MKVLLADDEAIGRMLLKRWLEEWGYEVIAVENGQDAVRALEADLDIRLAIVDWIMPVLDGTDVCRWIRARPVEPYVYAILLTARDNKVDIVEGLDAGADDYIVKPCHPLELRVRLNAGRRVVELQQQLEKARDQLRFEAMHDSLTSLFNRAAIVDRLERELARSVRTGNPTSVVMADIDHFKRINDGFGHAMGDAVLHAVSSLLKSSLRPYDSVGRVGGEEFLIVLPECGLSEGRGVAERLRKLLSARPIAGIAVTASFGVASTLQSNGATADELTRAADAALYRAKRGGRNRAEWATEPDWALPPPPAVGAVSA